MTIISALPVTLVNGTTADATQVMSDFNFIVSQVNSNAASIAGGNAFTGAQTINGDTIATLSATQSLLGKTLTGPNGTVSAPTYSFSSSSSTGVWSPSTNTLGMATNGVNALYIDASQNIGVGVTPSAWWSNLRAIDIGNGSFTGGVSASQGTSVYYNSYYNGSSNIYKTAGYASYYGQGAGQHQWFVSPSGSAGGTITFTQAMTLDNNGRLYGSSFHNNASLPTGATNQYIASGTYTPTISAKVNTTSSPTISANWIRVGNVVNVAGLVSGIGVTSSSQQTSFSLSLPISSTFGAASDLNGSGTKSISGSTSAQESVIITGSSNLASFSWFATVTPTASIAFVFQYTVL